MPLEDGGHGFTSDIAVRMADCEHETLEGRLLQDQ